MSAKYNVSWQVHVVLNGIDYGVSTQVNEAGPFVTRKAADDYAARLLATYSSIVNVRITEAR